MIVSDINIGLVSNLTPAAADRALPGRNGAQKTNLNWLLEFSTTLAPPGRHVASLFVQHAPAEPEGGWDAARDSFADRVLALVDEVAPGFANSVLHREVLAPPDLERIFALSGGNIFHGAMTLDRLHFLRPLPEWGHYRTPIRDLYLCGAGTHPGGGVMGACGRNAAREILREMKRKRKAGTLLNC